MTPLQLIEGSGVNAVSPTDRLERSPWISTAAPHPRGSSAVAVVLAFGAIDRRGTLALGEDLRAVPAAAREVALSCDVGVRTFARALTIRLWVLDDWRTRANVKRLASAIARSRGVALLLSGDLAASAEFVDAALAASDHLECALAPDELAPALDRARAALWAAPRRALAGAPAAGISASNDRAAADVDRHRGGPRSAESRSWSGGRVSEQISRRRGT